MFCLCFQRKCIVEELRKQPELDLSALSSEFAVTLPYVSLFKTYIFHRFAKITALTLLLCSISA